MIVALDYGEKRTGFAYSDETETFAFAGDLITDYKDLPGLLKNLGPILSKYNPRTVVIGDPSYKGKNKNMDNINILAESLRENSMSVVFINEFYTSEIAKVNLKGTKISNIDSESARQILQEYLDTLK